MPQVPLIELGMEPIESLAGFLHYHRCRNVLRDQVSVIAKALTSELVSGPTCECEVVKPNAY